MPGTPSQTARGSTVRWDLQEAAGTRPTRGTRTACEAAEYGRGRVGVRSPMAAGILRCRCGGDGGQVTRLTLGALSTGRRLGRSRGFPTGGQKSAEGEKDRRRDARPERGNLARGHNLVSRRRRRYASGEAPTPRDGGGRQSPCARCRASHGTGGNGTHRTTDPAGDGGGAAPRAPHDRLNTGPSPSGGAGHRRPDGR